MGKIITHFDLQGFAFRKLTSAKTLVFKNISSSYLVGGTEDPIPYQQ